MGFWRNLLFGAPKPKLILNPRTNRPYTPMELNRLRYEQELARYRQDYFKLYGKYPQELIRSRPIPSTTRVQMKKPGFLGEMFSTNFNGPMPNNQKRVSPTQKKGGLLWNGLIGTLRRTSIFFRR